MNRPWLLRCLPDRLRMAVWARCYLGKHDDWRPLYESADLRYAPGVQMNLVPGDVISDAIAFTGLFERGLTRRVTTLARQSGLLVDVGANLGYFTLLWAAARPDNRCLAIEASPRNLDRLRRNVERNGFTDRVTIVPSAAGEASGRVRFDLGPEDQTGWGGIAGTTSSQMVEVDVVRIDDLVPEGESVAMLKIDIEGADALALKGCERLLRQRRVSEIRYEQNKPRLRDLGLSEALAEEFLRSVGYLPRPESDPLRDLVDWSAVPE